MKRRPQAGRNKLSARFTKLWSQLATVMEEEVFVKIKTRCTYTRRGKPIRWVYQKVRQEENNVKGLEGRECPAGLLEEFCDVIR